MEGRRLEFAATLNRMSRQQRRNARRKGLFTARQEKKHLKEYRRHLKRGTVL